MIAFSLWPIHVYRYGIMYAVSFLVWYTLLVQWQQRWWYKNYPFIDKLIANDIDGLLIAVVLWVMIGGRLGHVIIYDLPYFIEHPLKIFAFQEWGMSFIGGIIWVILSIWFFVWKSWYSKSMSDWITTTSLSILDTLMPLIPLGVSLWRFGNFLNQELYGIVIPRDARWLPSWIIEFCQTTQLFHIYSHIGPELRLNTNFLSILFEGLMIALLIRYFFFRFRVPKRFVAWQLSAIWLGCYSLVRFSLEYLRQDSQMEVIWYFSKSQYIFIVFIIISVVFITYPRSSTQQ